VAIRVVTLPARAAPAPHLQDSTIITFVELVRPIRRAKELWLPRLCAVRGRCREMLAVCMAWTAETAGVRALLESLRLLKSSRIVG
jgi:hypothetical protein